MPGEFYGVTRWLVVDSGYEQKNYGSNEDIFYGGVAMRSS